MLDSLILLLVSLFTNTMSAFAGGGSGLIQFPALLLLGLPFAQALATHKTATFMLGAGSMARNINNKDIDKKFAAYVLLCGVFGTILGAFAILKIPDQIAQTTLRFIIIALGIYSMFKKDMGKIHAPQNRDCKGLIIGGLGWFCS